MLGGVSSVGPGSAKVANDRLSAVPLSEHRGHAPAGEFTGASASQGEQRRGSLTADILMRNDSALLERHRELL